MARGDSQMRASMRRIFCHQVQSLAESDFSVLKMLAKAHFDDEAIIAEI